MVKYIVFDSGSSASRLMFADVKQMPNAVEASNLFSIPNPFFRLISRVHLSGKINRKIDLPMKGIWDKYCLMEEAKKHPENDYIIIFTNVSVKKIRVEYLQEMSRLTNVNLVLVAVDSFVDQFLCPMKIMKQVNFSLVYSFDLEDCKKHNLKHTVSLYSKRTDIQPTDGKNDLFWIGRAKDRLPAIIQTVKMANTFGLHCQFYVLGVDQRERIEEPGITYIDSVIPYEKVLPQILASKCLLDIVQEGQNGMTMRVYEAIFYNKKLITNSQSVKELKYYAPERIQIIDTVQDIDFSFIADTLDVDYCYEGDYSPIYFLNTVEKDLRQEGKL